ncbi:MAG: hypothetical protein HXY25_01180 [Alphaproteobacteria bacterium]|nr:hypothetical protein [Alphaproteobacteria bacterium]
MSFKSFSTSQTTPAGNAKDPKAKTAPATAAPAPQPAKAQTEAAPGQKR